MSASLPEFRKSALIAVEDIRLQESLDHATSQFRDGRNQELHNYPGADELRDHFKSIRAATITQLGNHLETFERNAVAAGARVHWAQTSQEACQSVIEIANQNGVTMAAKSKSMATEEIHLNQALENAGLEVVETDLGEWIIQLAGEPPSHIIAPAIHKTRFQVGELFREEAETYYSGDEIQDLTHTARKALREKFLAAGMGISGANIGVAETGSIILVTNEGNGRMVSSLPPIHVVIIGIEKIAPNWEDASAWLTLLARSATGQPLSVYTTVLTGPARSSDPDGPDELHIILLDKQRSRYIGTKYEEVLQCIRCGACLNVCPVYREAGGHAYGSPYSGPIGAVVSPLLFGLETYEALPQASSLCGACLVVCPVRIDLPRMLLELRQDSVSQSVLPGWERALERSIAWALGQKRIFTIGTSLLRILQRPFIRQSQLNLPAFMNPAGDRKLQPLAPRSFRDLWKDLEK